MPNNASTAVARTDIEIAGRKHDRASATKFATTLITEGKSVPKELAVFLREDKASKKALTTARGQRKTFLQNSGFTLITEAQSRGFRVVSMTAPKTSERTGAETFSVRLQKPGSDGKVNVVEIKNKLTSMSRQERATILAELAKLSAEVEQMPDSEHVDVQAGPIETSTPAEQPAAEPAH